MQRSALCRSRRELSNAYFVAKFGFDTAVNEPFKVCPLSAYRSPRLYVSMTNGSAKVVLGTEDGEKLECANVAVSGNKLSFELDNTRFDLMLEGGEWNSPGSATLKGEWTEPGSGDRGSASYTAVVAQESPAQLEEEEAAPAAEMSAGPETKEEAALAAEAVPPKLCCNNLINLKHPLRFE